MVPIRCNDGEHAMHSHYNVKAGIWDVGPVVFLSQAALESFEERGAFMIYDQRNRPSFTLSADITDDAIRFFIENTNEPKQVHILPPMENGPRGYSGLITIAHEISRTHDVRCHLFEAQGYWDDITNKFTVHNPCVEGSSRRARPHELPFPNKKDLTEEMILADVDARCKAAVRFTGRQYVNFPPHYHEVITPDMRKRWAGCAETGEAW
jgi:hypothetical protein